MPDEVSPYDILFLLKKIGGDFGFSASHVLHLEYLINHTREQDWEAGARPIMFAQMTTQAYDLGVSEEQIRVRENALHELGALTWNDSGNYKRGGWRDPETGQLVMAYGVDLSPLAGLYDALSEAAERRDGQRRVWKIAKGRVHSLRGRVRSLLDELRDDPDVGLQARQLAFEQAYALNHRWDIRASTSCHALEREIAGLVMLRTTICEVLEAAPPLPDSPICPDVCLGDCPDRPAAEPVDNPDSSVEIWTRAHMDMDHIQSITNNIKSLRDTCNPPGRSLGDNCKRIRQEEDVVCQTPVPANTAAERVERSLDPAHAQKPTSPPGGGQARLPHISGEPSQPRRPKRHSTGMEHLDLWQCLDAADGNFTRFLPDDEEHLGWPDFVQAANALRPLLGISRPIWRDAMDSIGREAAAVCILLTSHHATVSSGGYFRRMIERAGRGELHLHKSVFAILKRSEFDG